MANGETLKELREILASGATISPTIGTRMTLSAIADMYEALRIAQDKEEARHTRIDDDLHLLKEKSIMLWIDHNRPVALFLGTLIIIVMITAQDLLVPVMARALGITLP